MGGGSKVGQGSGMGGDKVEIALESVSIVRSEEGGDENMKTRGVRRGRRVRGGKRVRRSDYT